jgi:hypothetical protein
MADLNVPEDVERGGMVPEIERDMLSQRPARRKSLLDLCADLGPAPSDEDSVEIRHEM